MWVPCTVLGRATRGSRAWGSGQGSDVGSRALAITSPETEQTVLPMSPAVDHPHVVKVHFSPCALPLSFCLPGLGLQATGTSQEAETLNPTVSVWETGRLGPS